MSRSTTSAFNALIWWVAIWIVIVCIAAFGFSDERPVRTAETFGFTKVQIESSSVMLLSFQGCGELDSAKIWYMTGTNPQGEKRDFVVCGSLFGGNSLRVK